MRVKLSIQYHTEREEICKKLIEILDLDENNSILLCDLEKDIEKQTKILDMKDDIQKYFAVSCLAPYKPNATCKRPYINILRGILRKQGYTFSRKVAEVSNNDGTYFRSTKYKMFRNK
tara:strand:- start:98 stop:451 length:354 start_codon:yes stop_codon:yes gene_type:complete